MHWSSEMAPSTGVVPRICSHPKPGKLIPRLVSHRFTEEESQRMLLTCNQSEFASLPPGLIVPILA